MLKDDNIQAINYTWKNISKGSETEIGFTAQMFEPYNIKGLNGENNGIKFLNYEKITCLLWRQNRRTSR